MTTVSVSFFDSDSEFYISQMGSHEGSRWVQTLNSLTGRQAAECSVTRTLLVQTLNSARLSPPKNPYNTFNYTDVTNTFLGDLEILIWQLVWILPFVFYFTYFFFEALVWHLSTRCQHEGPVDIIRQSMTLPNGRDLVWRNQQEREPLMILEKIPAVSF
jgi:hypothetical protein